ncbi:Sec-independent protein translocase protein TatB [Thiomonas sp.]|jgi:sec-independent protein translocase protein TatB|uniref:Sec-independent protein translocase protein TatB n=1 Tax=Thiomonas sp. TaxID=2047785 RepID=UPI002633065A|nr:Sec-independent protein translocase protein TatB [Thiomonas sp.]
MFDIGMSELGLIGVVALVVLGPEKLPRVARTAGNLLGRAQRYLAEVKAEVNRQIDLEELRKVKTTLETAAQDMQKSVAANVAEVQGSFDEAWKEATAGLHGSDDAVSIADGVSSPALPSPNYPTKKRKKLAGNAVPQWYRRQARVRTRALSGAARVARYRVKR